MGRANPDLRQQSFQRHPGINAMRVIEPGYLRRHRFKLSFNLPPESRGTKANLETVQRFGQNLRKIPFLRKFPQSEIRFQIRRFRGVGDCIGQTANFIDQPELQRSIS